MGTKRLRGGLLNHKKGRGRGSLGESHRSQGCWAWWGLGFGRVDSPGEAEGRVSLQGRSVGGARGALLRHPQITCTQIKSLFTQYVRPAFSKGNVVLRQVSGLAALSTQPSSSGQQRLGLARPESDFAQLRRNRNLMVWWPEKKWNL